MNTHKTRDYNIYSAFADMRKRVDFFLIWGHGLPFEDEIMSIIEGAGFSIIHVVRHRPVNMKAFVRSVYDYDYAPFSHLREKTKYLLRTMPEVLFLFVENNNPREVAVGQGPFRHLECCAIRETKNVIREIFNPRVAGKVTSNHVIHASDNPIQTDNVLRNLGYRNGILDITSSNGYPIHMPYHIPAARRVGIERIPIEMIYCSQLVGERYSFSKIICPIKSSVQFRAARGDMNLYKQYISTHRGVALKDMYSVDRYKKIISNADFFAQKYYKPLVICVPRVEGGYLLVDGVHRAAAVAALNDRAVITSAVLYYGDDVKS